MGALELPAGVISALDSIRRAFLWTAMDKVSGAKCLVAWERACRPKKEGGLGICSLRIQNHCLLIKLLHRLFSHQSESWPRWVWSCLNGEPIDNALRAASLTGCHWRSLLRLLPLYRDISRVSVGDGRSTSFWLDSWLPVRALAVHMPELFSHCSNPAVSVHSVMADGLDAVLVRRLTATAESQRRALLAMLSTTNLTGSPDSRSLPLCGRADGGLRSASLYSLCSFGGEAFASHDFLWRSHASSKVKFFGWLLVHGRIQCRANLLLKSIVDISASGCAICSAPLETPEHIIFDCPFARAFWTSIGCTSLPTLLIADARLWPLPLSAPTETAATLRLLCFWHLWKHRNGVVFEGLAPSIPLLRQNCRADVELWSARLPHKRRSDTAVWLGYFQQTHHPC
ncbi:unnamed protein product [Alopecurus aequalis]